MPVPKPEDIRMMLVDAAFQSDAFVVAKGEKTKWMLEVEADRAKANANTRTGLGQPGLSVTPSVPNPDPAPPPVLDKLAGILKFLAANDQQVLGIARKNFIDHFNAVFLPDGTDLGALAPSIFDGAGAGDATYQELRRLGMHKGGEAYGLDSVVKFVKNKTYTHCMPNGSLDDDFTCLATLMSLDADIAGGKIEWSIMAAAVTINRVAVDLDLLVGRIRIRIGETYSVPRGKNYQRFSPSADAVVQALMLLAKENPFHAGQEALNAMPKWDGIPRFQKLLELMGGAKDVSDLVEEEKAIRLERQKLEYAQLWKTFVGAVARTYEPGCQMDTMLVLKSAQGAKKSSLFRALAPGGLFSDSHVEFGNKDSYMSMQRVMIYECAELAGMLKREIQIVKNFVTTRIDSFRMPYARGVTDNPRHCILVGSTNDEAPLKDPTGSRRFWVIEIGEDDEIKIYEIELMVPQLWAEAIHLYRAKATCPDCQAKADGQPRCPAHRWWLTKEEDTLRAEVNKQYTVVDPLVDWFGALLQDGARALAQNKQGLHLGDDTFNPGHAYRVSEILALAPGMKDKQLDPFLQQRMISALRAHKWMSRHTKGGNVWFDPRLHKDFKVIEGGSVKANEPKKDEDTTKLKVVKKTGDENK